MKFFLKMVLLGAGLSCASASLADVYVHGYTRSDGTYVEPHHRSDPDRTDLNNWSTIGNTNPYTGKPGWKEPRDGYNNNYRNRSNNWPYQ